MMEVQNFHFQINNLRNDKQREKTLVAGLREKTTRFLRKVVMQV